MRVGLGPISDEMQEALKLLNVRNESRVGISCCQDASGDVKRVFRLHLLMHDEGAEEKTAFGDPIQTVNEKLFVVRLRTQGGKGKVY